MKDSFKKQQAYFLFKIIIFSLVLYGIHHYIIYHFANDIVFFFPIWQLYIFNIFAALLVFTIINYKYSKGFTKIFNFFLLGTILKMTLAVIFLSPLLLSNFDDKIPDTLSFFSIYFLFLIFEIYALQAYLTHKTS
jgi:hypothetical protein